LVFFGVIFSVYTYIKSKRTKKLVYDFSSPVSISGVTGDFPNYKLRLAYFPAGTTDLNNPKQLDYLETAYISYLRILNVGTEPILASDNSQKDPLRIIIHGKGLIHWYIFKVTRKACDFRINVSPKINMLDDDGTNEYEIPLEFEYFDIHDGFALEIFSNHENVTASVSGSIIGMPKGVKKFIKPKRISRNFYFMFTTLFSLVFMMGYIALDYLFDYFNIVLNEPFSWLIPIAILISLSLLFFRILFGPLKNNFPIPTNLQPPNWYVTMSRNEFFE